MDGVGGYERSLFMPFRTTPIIHSLVAMNIRLSKEARMDVIEPNEFFFFFFFFLGGSWF